MPINAPNSKTTDCSRKRPRNSRDRRSPTASRAAYSYRRRCAANARPAIATPAARTAAAAESPRNKTLASPGPCRCNTLVPAAASVTSLTWKPAATRPAWIRLAAAPVVQTCCCTAVILPPAAVSAYPRSISIPPVGAPGITAAVATLTTSSGLPSKPVNCPVPDPAGAPVLPMTTGTGSGRSIGWSEAISFDRKFNGHCKPCELAVTAAGGWLPTVVRHR